MLDAERLETTVVHDDRPSQGFGKSNGASRANPQHPVRNAYGPQGATGAANAYEPYDAAADGAPAIAPAAIDADALADMMAYSSLREKRKKAKRKKVVKIVVGCSVAAIVVIGAATWLLSSLSANPADDMPLPTALVEKGVFSDAVTASGKLKPVSSVSATPEVDGLVGEVFVSEGDSVTKDQALYTIVNDGLDKAVVQAQQGINEASNGVAQAQLAVDEAYRAKQAGINAAASAPKTGGDGGDAPTPEAPVFDVAQADAAIRQAELSLSSAQTAYANAQAAYDDAVATAAKRTVVSAIDGSVVSVSIEPGKAVGGASAAASSPMQIADLSQMTVSVEVNEIDILKIEAGQDAVLTFSAIPDLELIGTVSRIATVNTGSSGGADMGYGGTVTYKVDLLIEKPDPRLKPGMTAKASIQTRNIEDVLMVPVSAVTALSATEGSVYVIDPENPESMQERSVEIIASNGLVTAVKGSLSEGDEIVLVGDAGGSSMGYPSDRGVASDSMGVAAGTAVG